MANRIPALAVVAGLNRDDWERLCNSICVLLFSSHRVEDRHGKGNGLDAWRRASVGIEGWQFRRYDGRLGDKQTHHIIESINLAKIRCLDEMKRPLVKYNLVFNIDPEPGHCGQKGEIERLAEIDNFCTANNIAFEFFGVSWVHGQLLKSPFLMPELFENISEAIAETRAKVLEEVMDIKKELQSLASNNDLGKKMNQLICKVIEEATTHYERGIQYESAEEYNKAIASLEDAARLVVDQDLDAALEGRIFMVLSGVCAITGHLKKSIESGEKAISLLTNKHEKKYLLFAKGNLGIAYYISQEFEAAEPIFLELLAEFEKEGNLVEIVRTLCHLVELNTQQNKNSVAMEWADRTRKAVLSLNKMIGFSDHSLSAMGTVANALAAIGSNTDLPFYPKALHDAMSTFKELEKISEKVGAMRMKLGAMSGRANCLWHLDKLDEAITLYRNVISETETTLPKMAIDASFNMALILLEQNKKEESRALLDSAKTAYADLGDFRSVEDVNGVFKRHFGI